MSPDASGPSPVPSGSAERSHAPSGSSVRADVEYVAPITLTGRRDASIAFHAVAIGFSETGLGFRSSDQKLGLSSLEALIRQPFVLRFEGVATEEIIVRILRIEACRHDPTYLYFGAAEFLSISDLDSLTIQTGLKVFESKKKPPPFISVPPPPPASRG